MDYIITRSDNAKFDLITLDGFAEFAKRKIAKEYRADKVVRSLENLLYSHLYESIDISAKSLVKNYSGNCQ